MENIFDDHELNTKADIIINAIEKSASPIVSGGMMSSFNDNGLKVAKDLMEICLPALNFIKSKVNSKDENFLDLSDATALTISAIIKMPVNSISMIANTKDFHSNQENVRKVKADLANATQMMSIISNFELTSKARSTIIQNINRLNEAEKRVNLKPSGCYIATCVYGSYNNKEVLILRSFRDNLLSKTIVGRITIKLYYMVSPIIVNIFGKSLNFRKFVKYLLDNFIIKLKKNRIIT